jgi:hypothetical protein
MKFVPTNRVFQKFFPSSLLVVVGSGIRGTRNEKKNQDPGARIYWPDPQV